VVLAAGHRGVLAEHGDHTDIATVTVVTGQASPDDEHVAVARRIGTTLRIARRPHAVSFLARTADGEALLRALHSGLGRGHSAVVAGA
jgi:hypothetical protein